MSSGGRGRAAPGAGGGSAARGLGRRLRWTRPRAPVPASAGRPPAACGRPLPGPPRAQIVIFIKKNGKYIKCLCKNRFIYMRIPYNEFSESRGRPHRFGSGPGDARSEPAPPARTPGGAPLPDAGRISAIPGRTAAAGPGDTAGAPGTSAPQPPLFGRFQADLCYNAADLITRCRRRAGQSDAAPLLGAQKTQTPRRPEPQPGQGLLTGLALWTS
jgi:hypothetical protein